MAYGNHDLTRLCSFDSSMPQGPQRTGPEGGPVVEAEPLLGLARQLRLGLEVQNRKVAKKVHRCCFLGGEAVSFLTSR